MDEVKYKYIYFLFSQNPDPPESVGHFVQGSMWFVPILAVAL